jgi:hypothetical protein
LNINQTLDIQKNKCIFAAKNTMSIFKFKQAGRISLFDKDESSEKLSKLGYPLEKLHIKK